MKIWTISAAMLALSVLVVSSASAQDGERKRPNREQIRKQILEKFDKDKDGKLNDEERAAARKAWAERQGGNSKEREARRAEFMKRFDKDGDGKLSEEERAAARKAFQQRRGEGQRRQRGEGERRGPRTGFYAEILKKFDKNKDGKLDEEERAAARKAGEERRAEMMKKFDKDGDGKLNDEERAAMRKSFGERRGPRPEGRRPEGRQPERKRPEKKPVE